jgi:tRNA pseudouridine13 synthase
MTEAVIKHRPEEFLVRENLVVAFSPRSEASYEYLLLRKCGYTTMEACRLVALELNVPPREVSYGGLKDEDAITEQLLSVPRGSFRPDSRDCIVRHEDPPRWMEMQRYGYGADPLQVGMLEGNGFQLVIRNLNEATAAHFQEERRLHTFFLNYYDVQRFGVPDGPKRTHLVGGALLDGRWDDALAELAVLRSPESELAEGWACGAQQFFQQLDPRNTSFYLAAHSSYRFNTELASRVMRTCADANVAVDVEGLQYRYVTTPQAAAQIAADAAWLPYIRYGFSDGVPRPRPSQRATVVQVTINVCSVEDDETYQGRRKATVRFFLPSGCYATAAIRQLTNYRPSEIGGER